MKKVLTLIIAAAMMMTLAFTLSSCGDEPCNGDEIGKGANQISRKEPTCTSQGYIEYECSKGGAPHVQILEALGHKNIKWFTDVAATCTSDGAEHSECTLCGQKVETKVIPKTGHNESGWIIDKDATCLDNGSKHTECENCHETISKQPINATGHTMESEPHILLAVTCTSDGEQYVQCENCDFKIYEVIPTTGHDPKAEYTVRRPATCKVEGYEELECANCSEILGDRAISPIPHNRVDEILTPPTCTENGLKQVVCSMCGSIFGTETVFALNHDIQLVVDVAPTCTLTGIGHNACANCELSYASKTLPALGHAMENGVCTNLGCDVYEITVNVVYSSPSLHQDFIPESYTYITNSDEEIEPPVIESFPGFVHIIKMEEDGNTVTCNVVYLYNTVKLVTSIEQITLDVPYNTSFADLGLPTSIRGYTDDGEVVYLTPKWSEEDYDPQYNIESQVIKATITLTTQSNSVYLAVNEAVAVVTLGPKIVSIDDVVVGEVAYNTPFENLSLPATVVAYDERGESYELSVTWSSTGYNSSVAGVQTITGTAVATNGRILRDVIPKTTVIVVKNIVSADDVDFGLVVYGTKFINTNVPETVKCYAEDGTAVELGVVWNTDLYDPNLLGPQTLTGRVVGVDGYKVSDIEVKLNIDIKKKIETIPVAPAGYINLGYITLGTSFESIPNFHNTYSVIDVITNDGETAKVRIIWDRSSYDSTAYGENTIIGHFDLSDDLWIEDTVIVAKYVAIG